ncbi:CerR family C-terminal domain-containing protein [bacterium]|nr:CerR family C-terminal domain-containing protein [bacterium]
MPTKVRSDEKRIAGRGQKSSDSECTRLIPATKERILASATKLFAQKGFDGVGIREICKDADANICMISYFWGGKEGLYQGILDDLIQRQTEYVKTFLNLEIEPETLSKKEQVDLLYTILDNAVEMLYGGFISADLMKFLLQEQQRQRIELTSPLLVYVRKLITAIFGKKTDDKDVIFKTIFIISQINSPKIMPAFSLKLLKQEKFSEEDKNIIKNNVRTYIQALLKG